jgi:enamine deaminase RidA (YjgF/YER057c/UK114 family)
MKKLILASLLASGLASGVANAEEAAIRYPLINSDFPISRAVEIPAESTVVYLSGSVPGLLNPDAPKGSIEAYGNTEEQTLSVLKRIDENLKSLGLTMGDVVKMQAFLVGDPKLGGRMDFSGFMKSYVKFFGTKEQPNVPSRSALQIAGLANPGFLVEIEVTAVRPK